MHRYYHESLIMERNVPKPNPVSTSGIWRLTTAGKLKGEHGWPVLNNPPNVISYYIVSGGGGGGGYLNKQGAGGGGGGGILVGSYVAPNSQIVEPLIITIGAGGVGGINDELVLGQKGSSSSIFGENLGTVSSEGGGAGAGWLDGSTVTYTGQNGGSGGGGSGVQYNRDGGLGTTGQGNAGAAGIWSGNGDGRGGGGGGKLAAATDSNGGTGQLFPRIGGPWSGGGGGGVSSLQVGGLYGQFFSGNWRDTISTGNIGTLPLSSPTLYTSISYGWYGDYYGFIAIGYFKAPITGTYTFSTTSDDGSGVWLGSIAAAASGRTTTNALINNGLGLGGGATVSNTIDLTAGTIYPIRIVHEEGFGEDGLTFTWTGPGMTATTDLSTHFYYFGSGENYQTTGDLNTGSSGGAGGGGRGGTLGNSSGTNGVTNTGGGGGGASSGLSGFSGNGGSGVVVITYSDLFSLPISTTGNPIYSYNYVDKAHTYTWYSNGTIAWV